MFFVTIDGQKSVLVATVTNEGYIVGRLNDGRTIQYDNFEHLYTILSLAFRSFDIIICD